LVEISDFATKLTTTLELSASSVSASDTTERAA
jgi:hypothetical protein